MRIVGLDLSWTETGIATFEDGIFKTAGVIVTKPTTPDMERAEWIVEAILTHANSLRRGKNRPLVAIEGYSFGALAGREKMGELGGIVRWELFQEGFEYVVYPVFTWRKVLLGKAIGDKATVAMRLAQRYNWGGGIDNVNALEAAAVAQCAWLHRQPAETWTKAQGEAFAVKKARRRAA